MWKQYVVGIMMAVLATGLAIQFRSGQRLRSQLAELSYSQAEGRAGQAMEGESLSTAPKPGSADRRLEQRVAQLENVVAELTRSSDYLMSRGQLPLATNKIEDLALKLGDVTASDRDRLAALRLLRRNGAFTDAAVQHAVAWLQSATNANVREDVLEQLEGATNTALLAPLLKLASADADSDIREQAVDNLQRFAANPEVENSLWHMLQNDPSADVREQAAEALREAPMSETRLADLRQRALDAEKPLEERLVALGALQNARVEAPEVSAAFAQLAAGAQDSMDRIRLFRAFDDTRDPALVPPLVQGLQDANPMVREEAVDALSNFNSDPAIQQWLRHVAENDADPQVRREAFSALEDDGD